MGFNLYKDIKMAKIDPNNYLRTGINKLDRRIIGFPKGQVVIITGARGGGKTTLVNFAINNFINTGHCGLHYNFEMRNDRDKYWTYLQLCGKDNLVSKTLDTGTEVFEPKNDLIVEKIDNWLGDKIQLYDNMTYNFKPIRDDLVKRLEAGLKIDFVAIDNLMRMDIAEFGGDKYLAQIKIMKSFQEIASKYNICIIFVCHPNKVKVLPRIEDVSGSGDIINIADIVIIGHRVTEDFRIRAKEYFGWTDDNPIFQYDNVWEVAKSRDGGNDNVMIGTYFEPCSKRFLNEKGENKHYGWEELPTQEKLIPNEQDDTQDDTTNIKDIF